jgi:hypothetical protein
VAHLEVFQRAAEAVEAELGSVRALLEEGGALPALKTLARLVAQEEDACGAEARRMDARAAEVRKAAAELPVLVERLGRLEAGMQAGAALGVGLPAAAGAAHAAVQRAVWEVQRFVSEGLESLALPAPRLEAVLAALQRAEEQVAKHVAATRALVQRREDALKRLRFLERKVRGAAWGRVGWWGSGGGACARPVGWRAAEQAFSDTGEAATHRVVPVCMNISVVSPPPPQFADLREDVADFCSKSDHLRVQLDADWKSNTCWWGSQSSHTQTDGSPIGRGEMKPISSVQVRECGCIRVRTCACVLGRGACVGVALRVGGWGWASAPLGEGGTDVRMCVLPPTLPDRRSSARTWRRPRRPCGPSSSAWRRTSARG